MNLLASLIVGGGPFRAGGVTVGSIGVANVRDGYVSGGTAFPGAAGDGTTDDTAAFTYWLGQRSGGGVVYIPAGRYRVRSGFTLGGNGITILGEGHDCTTLLVDDSGGANDLFTLTNLRGCAFDGFTIDTLSGSARTGGRTFYIKGGDTSQQLAAFGISRGGHAINVDMNNQFIGCQFDDNGAVGDWGTVIGGDKKQRFWRNFAAGQPYIFYNTPHGASHVIDNLFCYAAAAAGAGPGIKYRGSGDVKVQGVSTWGTGGGFVCDANASIAAAGDALLMFNNCEFDSTSTSGGPYDNFLVNFGASASGSMFITCSNVWIAGASGNGMHITGTAAPLVILTYDVGECFSNGAWGILVDNGAQGAGHVVIGANVDFRSNVSGATHFV